MKPLNISKPNAIGSAKYTRIRCRYRGFTLIELLSVIAIFGVLVAILVPTVTKVKAQAQESKCSANLRQLAVILLAYSNDNNGQLLAMGRNGGVRDPITGKKSGGKTWSFAIQDYMEESWEGRNDFRLQICPAAYDSFGQPENGVYRSYAINFNGERWDADPSVFINHNKPSQTVLFMDAAGKGNDGDCYAGFQSTGGDGYLTTGDWRHSGRINTVFLDGHVESFDQTAEDLADLRVAIENWRQ